MDPYKPELAASCMQARALVAQRRLADAIELYDRVIESDPDYALARADRGTAHALARNFEAAVVDLGRAFELGHTEAAAYSAAATACLELGRLQQSLEYFERAIEQQPDYIFAYYNRSRAFTQSGEVQRAIADLEHCFQLGPDEAMRRLIVERLQALRSSG